MNPFKFEHRIDKMRFSTLRSDQITAKRKIASKRIKPSILDDFLILDGIEGFLLQENENFLILDK